MATPAFRDFSAMFEVDEAKMSGLKSGQAPSNEPCTNAKDVNMGAARMGDRKGSGHFNSDSSRAFKDRENAAPYAGGYRSGRPRDDRGRSRGGSSSGGGAGAEGDGPRSGAGAAANRRKPDATSGGAAEGPAQQTGRPQGPRKPREMEADPHRLAQRQKQIDYGKNTLGYQRYLEQVPKHMRRRRDGTWLDPMTPDITMKCSKKKFDGMVKKWRRALHCFDDSGNGDEDLSGAEEEGREGEEDDGAGSPRSQCSLEGYLPPTHGKKRGFGDAFNKDAMASPSCGTASKRSNASAGVGAGAGGNSCASFPAQQQQTQSTEAAATAAATAAAVATVAAAAGVTDVTMDGAEGDKAAVQAKPSKPADPDNLLHLLGIDMSVDSTFGASLAAAPGSTQQQQAKVGGGPTSFAGAFSSAAPASAASGAGAAPKGKSWADEVEEEEDFLGVTL